MKDPDRLKKEFESTKIMRQCRYFESCSAPLCPLDLLQEFRDKLPGEAECTLPKSKRIRIAENTKLPWKGMTKTEWAARLRWKRLPASEKDIRIAKLRGF